MRQPSAAPASPVRPIRKLVCGTQAVLRQQRGRTARNSAPAGKGASGPWRPCSAGRSRRSSATNAARSTAGSERPGGGRARCAPRFLRSRCASSCVSRMLGSLATPAFRVRVRPDELAAGAPAAASAACSACSPRLQAAGWSCARRACRRRRDAARQAHVLMQAVSIIRSAPQQTLLLELLLI